MTAELFNIEKALELSRDDVVRYYKEYLNPALARMFSLLNFDKQFVRAEGVKLWDSEGNEYLDFLGGYGALNMGHNPPAVLAALERVEKMPNILQTSMGTLASAAACNLARIAPGDLKHSFFCNSGTEAVEGAIKTARIASGRASFIYCSNSFHGKTMGSLSVTGRNKYQQPFNPMLPGNRRVPFGDIDALEHELKNGEHAAFIVEPIQGEGGVVLPAEGYLKAVRELCDQYHTYLIIDEIQTGFGRTGALFACEEEGVSPDIMCLAKSLGGGVMPVGAFICRADIWEKAYGGFDKALLHTSTFGGNTRAAAAALTSIYEIVTRDLSTEAREKGEYLLNKLRELAERYEMIKEVRGRGLLIGMELRELRGGVADKLSGGLVGKLSHEYLGSMIAGALYNDHRIITAYTLNNPNVIRFEPPLIISYEEIDYLLEALEKVFEKNKGLLDLAVKSARDFLGGLFKR